MLDQMTRGSQAGKKRSIERREQKRGLVEKAENGKKENEDEVLSCSSILFLHLHRQVSYN